MHAPQHTHIQHAHPVNSKGGTIGEQGTKMRSDRNRILMDLYHKLKKLQVKPNPQNNFPFICYNIFMIKYLIILGLVVLAWCPWLKADEAMKIIDTRVTQMKEKSPDLCAMSINRDSIQKVPFGYTEKVSYDCAITDVEYGVLQSSNVVFITFYKGIFGMPNKTVAKQGF